MKKKPLQKTKWSSSRLLLSHGLETFDLRHGMPKTPRQSYSPTCMAEGCKCSASADQKCSAYRRIQGLAKFSVVVVVRSLFVKMYRKVLNAVLLLPHLLVIHPVQHYFFSLKFAINTFKILLKCSMAPACAGSGDRNCHSPKMAVARPDIDCVLANARNRFPAKYSQCKKGSWDSFPWEDATPWFTASATNISGSSTEVFDLLNIQCTCRVQAFRLWIRKLKLVFKGPGAPLWEVGLGMDSFCRWVKCGQRSRGCGSPSTLSSSESWSSIGIYTESTQF